MHASISFRYFVKGSRLVSLKSLIFVLIDTFGNELGVGFQWSHDLRDQMAKASSIFDSNYLRSLLLDPIYFDLWWGI